MEDLYDPKLPLPPQDDSNNCSSDNSDISDGSNPDGHDVDVHDEYWL